MHLSIVLAVFPVILVGELPDKTMFASLVLASRGRPASVWLGAAGAFLVHVAIATTVGVGLFNLLPHRVVEAFVAALFLVGAVMAFRESNKQDDEAELIARETRSHKQVAVTAFAVIFIAEWGDLTQILTADLAAHYHAAWSVGIGATLALWAVAGVAVISGEGLVRRVPVRRLRQVTAVVLLVLAVIAGISAIRG